TFDYPFPDYSVDGRDLDTKRMRTYVAEEPDANRYKSIEAAVERVELPAPDAALLPGAFAESLRTESSTPVDKELLLNILAMSFGEIGLIKGGRGPREPIVRRTSPSGGGRHPTEGYLLVLDVVGLRPGWYHVGVQPPRLSLLRELRPSEAELLEMFPL